jgi:hypothetical protein
MVSRRGLVIIGLSAVFWAVQAVFLVILGSEAAEGAPFSSQIVLGIGIRLDLRKIIHDVGSILVEVVSLELINIQGLSK